MVCRLRGGIKIKKGPGIFCWVGPKDSIGRLANWALVLESKIGQPYRGVILRLV